MNALDFYSGHMISPPSTLFDVLSDTFYFAKNREGQFVYPNKLLQEKFRLTSANDVIGKTDHDFFSMDIADRIRADDMKVMMQDLIIKNKLEVVAGANGKLYWLFTSKAPIKNKRGEIIGVEGFSKDAERSRDLIAPYQAFKNCIEYLQKHFMHEVSVEHLAELSCMSLSAFERKFKKHFSYTPNQYIKHMRIHAACRLLAQACSIKRTALEAGFCDQSYFTKEFKSVMGITPMQYQLSQKS